MMGFPSFVKPTEISVIAIAEGAEIFCKPDGVFSAIKCAPAMSSVLPPAGEPGFTHTLLANSGKSASLVQLWPRSRERKREEVPFLLSPAATYKILESPGSIAIAVILPKGFGSAMMSSSEWSELILTPFIEAGLG